MRSGKTFAMGLSFFLWAQARFDARQFGLCGKTIVPLRRNLLADLTTYLRRLGMDIRERRALRLHFTMEDNPALPERIRERCRRNYSGAFYRRFVLGEWSAAEGLVYDFFDPDRDAAEAPKEGADKEAVLESARQAITDFFSGRLLGRAVLLAELGDLIVTEMVEA